MRKNYRNGAHVKFIQREKFLFSLWGVHTLWAFQKTTNFLPGAHCIDTAASNTSKFTGFLSVTDSVFNTWAYKETCFVQDLTISQVFPYRKGAGLLPQKDTNVCSAWSFRECSNKERVKFCEKSVKHAFTHIYFDHCLLYRFFLLLGVLNDESWSRWYEFCYRNRFFYRVINYFLTLPPSVNCDWNKRLPKINYRKTARRRTPLRVWKSVDSTTSVQVLNCSYWLCAFWY